MFISPAYAQDAAAADVGFGFTTLVPLILIFVVFYFFLIRPQQRKVKEHKEMVTALRRGDRVVTQGGLLGTVTRVGTDNEILVEIAEGVRVRMLRTAVSEVLVKGEPAEKDKSES